MLSGAKSKRVTPHVIARRGRGEEGREKEKEDDKEEEEEVVEVKWWRRRLHGITGRGRIVD